MREALLKDLEYKIHFKTQSQLLEKANKSTMIKKLIESHDFVNLKKKHDKNLI